MRHKTMPRSFMGLAVAAILSGPTLAAPREAAAQTPDYTPFTATQFIPFTNYDPAYLPFTGAVQLTFTIAGQPFRATMDTGSTGVMLPASRIPGYDPAQAPDSTLGWEFLSSSKLLWVGHWTARDLVFLDRAGRPLATAHVPVLAVEKEVHCPSYVEASSGATCPDSALRPASSGIAYMGVGFGREYDGQPQGTPDKNALLNITAIGGTPVAAGQMRSGYIIRSDGVQVGLTAAGTQGFGFSPLVLQAPQDGEAPGDARRDWAEATACVSVNGSACATGRLLVDTGIDQMYLTVPRGMPVDTLPIPDPSVPCRKVRGLADGSQVQVSFQSGSSTVASYSFTVGDSANLRAPSAVVTSIDSAGAFVNTGRHLFRGFDVAYDADGGFFGLRPKPVPTGLRVPPTPAAPVCPSRRAIPTSR